jgi:hypothetical protein
MAIARGIQRRWRNKVSRGRNNFVLFETDPEWNTRSNYMQAVPHKDLQFLKQ